MIEDDNNIRCASPIYEGQISILRQDLCGFITNHNVPGFQDKSIYFSFKVLMSDGVMQGDYVRFNLGTSVDRIWAINVEKIE